MCSIIEVDHIASENVITELIKYECFSCLFVIHISDTIFRICGEQYLQENICN